MSDRCSTRCKITIFNYITNGVDWGRRGKGEESWGGAKTKSNKVNYYDMKQRADFCARLQPNRPTHH